MKQLWQNLRTGGREVVEVPVPQTRPGCVSVEVGASLVSAGTERMLVEFAEKNLLEKARARPDLVRQTLDKVRREGIVATVESVWSRLDTPVSLGYSCAGTVIGVGEGVTQFKVGDAVACASGYAGHAEVVVVPVNLVVALPPSWSRAELSRFEAGAFTTLGAIALQGIRLADVKLGEIVAVIGLGLVGQLTVQLLKAAGSRVIGMDVQPERTKLAQKLGADAVATAADEMQSSVLELSSGAGADAVLITADTESNEPVELAGSLAREQAVVVAVGNVGLRIPRNLYYAKELDFRVSRSYGPGRYDPAYEEQGRDYPIGFVRWTENRNMRAFVALLAEGKVDVQPLITHRFPIEEATRAYELIAGKTREPYLGVLIVYGEQPDLSRRVDLTPKSGDVAGSPRAAAIHSGQSEVTIGFLGAGNFAQGTLLPALRRIEGVQLMGVCTAGGLSARHAGQKFGFQYCTTDEAEILGDSRMQAVIIATRHHLHAQQAVAALNAGKHVFVEKPLALNEEELATVVEALKRQSSKILLTGFNRRFAPMAQKLKGFLSDVHEPLMVQYRVNAGYIPPDHWTQDPEQGGGRIIGEACHFIDFAGWLIDAKPVSVSAQALADSGRYSQDNVVITLKYPGGSVAVITYVANGDRVFGKERVEVHGGGRSALLDDFRRLELVKAGRRRIERSWWRHDKGHRAECVAFIQAVRAGGPSPIAFDELVATTRASFAAVESLRTGGAVEIMGN